MIEAMSRRFMRKQVMMKGIESDVYKLRLIMFEIIITVSVFYI